MVRGWNRSARLLAIGLGWLTLFSPLAAQAAGQPQPNYDADGTVHVNGVSVPPSSLASAEGREFLRQVIVDKIFANPAGPSKSIAEEREWQNVIMARFLAPMRRRYAVSITQGRIGGIVVDIVTPAGGIRPENKNRVLINLHGGGFMTGARSASLVESVPIAATMGIKVISVDYRMAPEYRFPAASEDVAAVYRELLKAYHAKQIGIYGCSAGGVLTGQSVAWFQAHGMPVPGAVGVFCASLGKMGTGDMGSLAMALNGMAAMPAPSNTDGHPATASIPPLPYLANADPNDPLAYPEQSPKVLAGFPPTLFITGTRAFEMSDAITSNNALTKAGVETNLHVWDAMIHGFFYNSEIPESQEVYQITANFFSAHLEK